MTPLAPILAPAALTAILFLGWTSSITAGEAPPAATAAPAEASKPAHAKPSDSPPEVELTADEKAEKEARKTCKIAICQAFHSKQSEGADVACNVVKSWRKEQLGKLVGKLKVSWPYGAVRCTTAVTLKRTEIVEAMAADKRDVALDKHAVACKIERDQDAPTDITFDFKPTVTFEKGKATKAKLNWGKVEAPTLIKSAIWTATAADNTVNILSSTLVEDINDFVSKKCDEVKDQWAGK
jgi:hypothetical protein